MMKSFFLPGLLLLICWSRLPAQDPANAPYRRKNNVPADTRRFEQNNQPGIGDNAREAFVGTNGIFKHNWSLRDGTKVASFFDLGSVKLTIDSGGSSKRAPRTEERSRRESSDDDWECVTKETRISMDNDDFLTVDNLDQSANIFPGAVYKFENYVNGSWLAETAQRKAFTISTAALGVNGASFEEVTNPTKSGIRSAVNTLTGRFGGTANGA